MKAVTYITENTIMKFLYNPKKTFLEGFVKEWLRFDSGTYQDYGKYVRFLKVAIRDNVSELYMQGYPWGTQKGCKDRPIGYIDSAAKFDRVAVIIDSSKIWPLANSSSLDAFLDSFEKGAYISSLTFTGGEISLNIPAIRYTLKAVKERGIAVGSFYMVTNGKAIDKMADLAMASLEWWTYCDEKDDDMCSLCISSDNFHEVIPYESKSILSGLKYNRNDKVTDFHLAYLLNEGRAKNLDSNIYKKREPHVDKLEYEFNKTGDIDFYSGELYLNAIGDVVSGCDWSYKSQKKYRFGNVMNKNWLENISNSELYIAS